MPGGVGGVAPRGVPLSRSAALCGRWLTTRQLTELAPKQTPMINLTNDEVGCGKGTFARATSLTSQQSLAHAGTAPSSTSSSANVSPIPEPDTLALYISRIVGQTNSIAGHHGT